jgi:hypothetical protein
MTGLFKSFVLFFASLLYALGTLSMGWWAMSKLDPIVSGNDPQWVFGGMLALMALAMAAFGVALLNWWVDHSGRR